MLLNEQPDSMRCMAKASSAATESTEGGCWNKLLHGLRFSLACFFTPIYIDSCHCNYYVLYIRLHQICANLGVDLSSVHDVWMY